MRRILNTSLLKATVILAVAFVVISCKSKLKTTAGMDLSSVPVQIVNDMFVVQSDNGNMQMRVFAPIMERYQSDTLNWETFPDTFSVFAYDEDGKLETQITALQAKHMKYTSGKEMYSAFGNVVVKNLINNETMETDTLYWDPKNERIFTDCYVRLISPKGYIQGYGMESDQRARSSGILHVFNSYGILDNDSTAVKIDSINFIGPFPKSSAASQKK